MDDVVKLLRALHAVAERWPGCQLRRNGIGNLSVIHRGQYVAFIDLGTLTMTEV